MNKFHLPPPAELNRTECGTRGQVAGDTCRRRKALAPLGPASTIPAINSIWTSAPVAPAPTRPCPAYGRLARSTIARPSTRSPYLAVVAPSVPRSRRFGRPALTRAKLTGRVFGVYLIPPSPSSSSPPPSPGSNVPTFKDSLFVLGRMAKVGSLTRARHALACKVKYGARCPCARR